MSGSDESKLSIESFLVSVPPGTRADVRCGQPTPYFLSVDDIHIHCFQCKGNRNFRLHYTSPEDHCGGCFIPVKDVPVEMQSSSQEGYYDIFLRFICCNCGGSEKSYAIRYRLEDTDNGIIQCIKYGEHPNFGPIIPNKLNSLVGSDRDLFLKGLRCENQGLGVGAFTYYRRVVEDQTTRIIQQIRKVAVKISAPEKSLNLLDAAIAETQFSKALEIAKDAIPQSLLLQGHNPLLFLHDNLSDGVHNLSDSECLEIAQDIRVVLSELSERLAQALKEDREVKDAFSRLMKRTSARKGGEK